MNRIETQIEEFIKTGLGDFNQLACELYLAQAGSNTAYLNFLSMLEKDVREVTRWDQITPLPICRKKTNHLSKFHFLITAPVFLRNTTRKYSVNFFNWNNRA